MSLFGVMPSSGIAPAGRRHLPPLGEGALRPSPRGRRAATEGRGATGGRGDEGSMLREKADLAQALTESLARLPEKRFTGILPWLPATPRQRMRAAIR